MQSLKETLCSPEVFTFDLSFEINLSALADSMGYLLPWVPTIMFQLPVLSCPAAWLLLRHARMHARTNTVNLLLRLYHNLGTNPPAPSGVCSSHVCHTVGKSLRKSQPSHFIPGLEALGGDISWTFLLKFAVR